MGQTVMDVFAATAERQAHQPAMKVKVGGSWKMTTWREYREQVLTAAKAMIGLGLEPGRTVSILGRNRPEWFIANQAAIHAGGVPTGIYLTSTPSQCQYIAHHNDSAIVVVEDQEQLAKLKKIRDELPELRAILLMEGDDEDDDVYSWRDLEPLAAKVPDSELEQRMAAQEPDDLATLIYTSGTTGNPKGVMLTHDNLTWTAKTAARQLSITADDRMLSYLPLSHIAEQVVSHLAPLAVGACSWFAESLDHLGENLREVRPTVFLGVPRVWEKIQAKMAAAGAQSGPVKKRLVSWARGVGLTAGFAEQRGDLRPLSYGAANTLVFSKVREKLGLDCARLCGTSAAPIARDTLEFFLSLGIPVYEIYGMSECTGPTTLSMPGAYRTGSAGPAMEGTELKIAPNGEVCMRGRHVFKGYYKDELATRTALDEEGWLHSGDVGELDDREFLTITDRLKELIITAGGENVPPAVLEAELKKIRAVGQAVVVGDRRKYLTALFTLDTELIHEELSKSGSKASDLASAAACEAFNRYLQRKLDEVNQGLARVQTIKRFTIIPREFTVDGGELTHTMKLKRRVIYEKYGEQIEAMYL